MKTMVLCIGKRNELLSSRNLKMAVYDGSVEKIEVSNGWVRKRWMSLYFVVPQPWDSDLVLRSLVEF